MALLPIARSKELGLGGSGDPAVRGQPFVSDAPSGGKTPELARKVKDLVAKRYDSKRPASYPPAVWLADRGLAELLNARADLLRRTRGAAPPVWADDLMARVSKAGPLPPAGGDKEMAIDSVQASKDIATLIATADEAADRGEVTDAFRLLNRSIMEILNTRAVGVSHIPAREHEMWPDMQVVLSLDPKFAKGKYNWARALVRTKVSDSEARETACRMLKEAIVDAGSQGIQGSTLLEKAREGDADWAPIRSYPEFGATLEEAGRLLAAQEKA